jgi:ribosome-binding factor A
MGKREGQRRRSRDRSAEAGEGFRTVRLQELIREEVSSMFDSEIGDARLDGVLITFVELTADGSCARLWYSAPEGSEPREALDRTAGFLRSRLAEALGLKRTPELRFRHDNASRTLDWGGEGR